MGVGASLSGGSREAAAHFERAAALHPAPAVKAELADAAAMCHRRAGAM